MTNRADYLSPGDWNAACYQCNRKFKASMLRRHWQGYYVCPAHWEPRQPQDFVRATLDVQTPGWTQPMPEDALPPRGVRSYTFYADSGSGTSADPYVFTPDISLPAGEEDAPVIVICVFPPPGVPDITSGQGTGPLPLTVPLVEDEPIELAVIATGGLGQPETPPGSFGPAWGEPALSIDAVSEPADLVVAPDGTSTTVVVTVTYLGTSNPVVGQVVYLIDSEDTADITPASGTTNASGEVTFAVSNLTAGTDSFIPVIAGVEYEDGAGSITFAAPAFYMMENATSLLGIDMRGNVALRVAIPTGLCLVSAIPGYAIFFDGTDYYSYDTETWEELAVNDFLTDGGYNPLLTVNCIFETYNSLYIIGVDNTATQVLRSINPDTLLPGSSVSWTGGSAGTGYCLRGGVSAGSGIAEYVWFITSATDAAVLDSAMTNFTTFPVVLSRSIGNRGLTYGNLDYGSVRGLSDTTAFMSVRETLTSNAEIDLYNAVTGAFVSTLSLGIPAAKFAAIVCDASDNVLIIGEGFCFHYLNNGSATLTNRTTAFYGSTLQPAPVTATSVVARLGAAYLVEPITV